MHRLRVYKNDVGFMNSNTCQNQNETFERTFERSTNTQTVQSHALRNCTSRKHASNRTRQSMGAAVVRRMASSIRGARGLPRAHGVLDRFSNYFQKFKSRSSSFSPRAIRGATPRNPTAPDCGHSYLPHSHAITMKTMCLLRISAYGALQGFPGAPKGPPRAPRDPKGLPQNQKKDPNGTPKDPQGTP